MEKKEITLGEVLAFREEKARIQTELLAAYPEAAVVSLGMNIPGPLKSSPSIYRAFQEGRRILEETIEACGGSIRKKAVLEEKAGYAAIYLIGCTEAQTLKRQTVLLEETHPLGRLFDMDVFQAGGAALSREQIGAGRRTCLICGQDAKACGRNRTHTVRELGEKVQEIIRKWEEEEQ